MATSMTVHPASVSTYPRKRIYAPRESFAIDIKISLGLIRGQPSNTDANKIYLRYIADFAFVAA